MKGLWGWGIAVSRGSVEGFQGEAPSLGTLCRKCATKESTFGVSVRP